MLIRFGHEISIQCQNPTPVICLLRTRSERKGDIRSLETTVTNPDVETSTYTDLFGNTCLRFVAPPGILSVWGDGTIEDSGRTDPVDWNAQEVPIADLPNDCLVYLLGSRYCETDRLSQMAWDTFGQTAPGWNRVQAICDFVHNHIRFNYMNARATRSAFEAFSEGTGVCRDFAHLAIALCRCMNIPARYVNGYLGDIGVPILDPMDFSAWMEVYLGGRWVTFDPRNNKPRIGRIVVAHGRDAADVPLIHSFGPHILSSFRVWTYDVTGLPLVNPVSS
ncbi:MAG: transglutaminase family protein [Rhodospirillum sp.]|nr:transglutaminase family protein [Rhodospirillum sp.]MCF8489512.1 transglutaminase family protein [Rhodospirillum sp.]MCF8500567.1 transglutaminase family protein [Rhodospirillum sp.]